VIWNRLLLCALCQGGADFIDQHIELVGRFISLLVLAVRLAIGLLPIRLPKLPSAAQCFAHHVLHIADG
jgi:hypothetical protein